MAVTVDAVDCRLLRLAAFWDVAPCGFIINQPFGRTCRQVPPKCSQSASYHLMPFLDRVISSTLKMEATHSSEMSISRSIPENGIKNIYMVRPTGSTLV
jgi:hypothetical protein